MATHSSTLSWRIPWTEEPGRLQSTGSQRVGDDWATSLFFFLSTRPFWAHTGMTAASPPSPSPQPPFLGRPFLHGGSQPVTSYPLLVYGSETLLISRLREFDLLGSFPCLQGQHTEGVQVMRTWANEPVSEWEVDQMFLPALPWHAELSLLIAAFLAASPLPCG